LTTIDHHTIIVREEKRSSIFYALNNVQTVISINLQLFNAVVFSDWAYYTKKHVNVDDVYGVYQLSMSRKDESHITYVGHGKLRGELLKFILGDKCKSPSMYFRYERTDNELKAEELKKVLLREYKEKYGRLPKCNS